MVGDGGAKNQAVKRVLKGEPSFAKRMGVVADVNTLAALRALKAALIIALPMVVADVAAMKVAAELQEINLVYASGTEVGRGARGRIAPKVQKVIPDSASLMVVAGAVNFQHVQRVHRGVQCSARHMVGVNDVHFRVAPRELKGALPSARGMVEESAAHFRVEVSAPRVCMVGPYSVLPMVVGRGALFLGAPRVLEDALAFVCAMEGASDASPWIAEKALRETLIFARHMEEANGAHGIKQAQSLALVIHLVIGFPGQKLVSVLVMMP
ncbi:hypothetical protein MUK42_22170 [Musa troglodytarum]|uniref:Uncharacterized protein n=1 Tax=Musa troglodytarum TaxID=320322 RepID=A0A9E7KA80_9LILI|nr:hypothetical protein MUK42_22170 [Musa troglodytarum]